MVWGCEHLERKSGRGVGGPAAFAGAETDVEPSQLGLLFGKGVTVAYQQPTFLRASAIPGTGSEDGRTPRPCVYSHS